MIKECEYFKGSSFRAASDDIELDQYHLDVSMKKWVQKLRV